MAVRCVIPRSATTTVLAVGAFTTKKPHPMLGAIVDNEEIVGMVSIGEVLEEREANITALLNDEDNGLGVNARRQQRSGRWYDGPKGDGECE
ncbi:hypothetical protein VNO78_06588 [Psophocarpus tetragonolobus]|uniref:Uncharacterized protein n=1 Tax=Psophocarpus tetragonolobus TaxID=3891 RepID=A0AAN9SVC5_PSOTE